MNVEAIDKLNELNNRFYARNHLSFSNSRNGAWPGWDRMLKHVDFSQGACIADVACGNFRFERYLQDRYPEVGFDFQCFDSCDQFPAEGVDVDFVKLDVIRGLKGDLTFGHGEFDVLVTFGFMHHIPSAPLRLRLLASCLDALKPGGVAAVSFWRFASDEGLRRKAEESTEQALQELNIALDEGDYILGWNGEMSEYRYCHSFSHDEIDQLLESVGPRATVLDRYDADGRTGALNEYLVLARR